MVRKSRKNILKNPYELIIPEFKCPRCSLKFNKTIDLYQHLREKHKKPKNCHICGHYFDAYASLLSHSYLHSGEKPYKCSFPNCEWSARTKQNLQVHMSQCQHCPNKKYLPKFPLPDRYKGIYKYQSSMKEFRLNQKNNKSKRNSKLYDPYLIESSDDESNDEDSDINTNNNSDNDELYIPPKNIEREYNHKRRKRYKENKKINKNIRTRWCSDEIKNIKSPPKNKGINITRYNVDTYPGWKLEMHKTFSLKSDIVKQAIMLISKRLNDKFVRNTNVKGLYVAVLKDPNNDVQSAALIHKNINYIEITSFATNIKHSRQSLGTLLAAFILENCYGKIIAASVNDDVAVKFWKNLGFIEASQGDINTFGRKDTHMLYTFGPYKDFIKYALTKFKPIFFINKNAKHKRKRKLENKDIIPVRRSKRFRLSQ